MVGSSAGQDKTQESLAISPNRLSEHVIEVFHQRAILEPIVRSSAGQDRIPERILRDVRLSRPILRTLAHSLKIAVIRFVNCLSQFN